MTTTPSFERLLKKLTERTLAGIAAWSPGSRDDTFIWSGTSASVVLSTKDQDGVSPYVVRLVDNAGRIVEEELFANDSNQALIPLVRDLYAVARANALNIDGTIEGLLDDLEP